MSQVSKLEFYSVGIVAKNKDLSSKEIEVTPIEDLPFANGELTDNTNTETTTAKDAGGSSYTSKVNSTNTVKAVWLPIGQPNRLTAPDVRRGENVMLYKYSDHDKYYWVTLTEDTKLRKLETVVYGFSGTTDESSSPNADNMYYLEVSTHRKLIHLHTSKANGELFNYDVQINGAEGFIQVQDNDGNYFTINSKDTIVELANADGSKLSLDKKVINLNAPDQFNIITKVMKVTADDIQLD